MSQNKSSVILSYKRDQSFLLRLRDFIPTIKLSGHWGAFGGTIDAGESDFEGHIESYGKKYTNKT